MGQPQWADLGMYIQPLMLLSVDQGLDTCTQEFRTPYARTVENLIGTPSVKMLFCGIALGYRHDTASVNSLRSRRAPINEWATFTGFEM